MNYRESWAILTLVDISICLLMFYVFKLLLFTTRHLCLQLSWIHEFLTYQGTWKSGDAFMNSWLIKVHENQVMKYESNICTAIIKVHENQVMQNLDHDGKWHDFATLTNCTRNFGSILFVIINIGHLFFR